MKFLISAHNFVYLQIKHNIMNTSDIIIAHPDKEKFEALTAFLKDLKIKFEIKTSKPYNDDFVNTVLQGDEDIKNGKGKKITLGQIDDLWK